MFSAKREVAWEKLLSDGQFVAIIVIYMDDVLAVGPEDWVRKGVTNV